MLSIILPKFRISAFTGSESPLTFAVDWESCNSPKYSEALMLNYSVAKDKNTWITRSGYKKDVKNLVSANVVLQEA